MQMTPEAIRLLRKAEVRRATAVDVGAVERQIDFAMSRAAARLAHIGDDVEVRTPLTALLLAEDMERLEAASRSIAEEYGDDFSRTYAAWFGRLLAFFFAEGPHPGVVLRRLYMVARRYGPDLIWGMNGTDLGMMFGESRAAQSYRINLLFDGLKAAGVRGNRGAGCKREEARETYAECATGNHNRRRSAGKKKKKKCKRKPIPKSS